MVCKVSRHFLLLLFFSLSFEFYLPIFCNCLFVNVHQHYCSWMYGHRCLQSGFFFSLETLLVIWPFDLNCSVLQYAIASQFDISPFNVTVHIKVSIWVKLQKTSETSKTFENNIIIVSCNTISKNQNLKNYPLTWKHGNEAKNIFSKTQIDFEVPNSKQEKTDRR